MKIEIHVIQSFGPSCLNRDDTGRPKTTIFGGKMRGRISSQCLKRARREYLDLQRDKPDKQYLDLDLGPKSFRTKFIFDKIKDDVLENLQPNKNFEIEIKKMLAKIAKKLGSDKVADDKDDYNEITTSALIFVSETVVKKIVDFLCNELNGKTKLDVDEKLISDKIDEIIKCSCTADIAMYARFIANNDGLRVNAACQVNDAITTHGVNIETDYFTGMDDLSKDIGAGHVGTNLFNSACYYNYTCIDYDLLKENLCGDEQLAMNRVYAEIDSIIHAHPKGKINSGANATKPSLVYVAMRDGQQACLVNAFDKCVKNDESGLIVPSINALNNYAEKTKNEFDIKNTNEFYAVNADCQVDQLGERKQMHEIAKAVAEVL